MSPSPAPAEVPDEALPTPEAPAEAVVRSRPLPRRHRPGQGRPRKRERGAEHCLSFIRSTSEDRTLPGQHPLPPRLREASRITQQEAAPVQAGPRGPRNMALGKRCEAKPFLQAARQVPVQGGLPVLGFTEEKPVQARLQTHLRRRCA
jgi:hypothetical protein